MKICPKCKQQTLLYMPWLGQIWDCKNCGYRGPLVIEMTARALRDLLKSIPRGKVVTYKQIAFALGIHQRAVAKMLSANDPKVAPCYKVICSNGNIGGYSGPGGVKKKIALLQADGIEVKNGKVNLDVYGHKF
ncbi:MAG: MGMT family protein [Candidatus Aenigmatarchaeota archaeon]|nr:MGMT family protein [Candidatus Aenigmarchaeota archaeon]